MGIVGRAKDLITEAQGKLAAADVAGANAAIDKLGRLLDTVMEVSDEVVETELVKDLDAAVESVRDKFPEIAVALQGLIKHFLRVGTRASNAAQEAQACLADVRAFLAALRSGEIKFTTETRVEKAE